MANKNYGKNYRNGGGYYKEPSAQSKSSADTKVRVIAVIVIVLVVVYVLTALTMGYVRGAGAPLWNPLKWGKSKSSDSATEPVRLAISSDGETIRAGSTYELRRSSDAGITYLTEIIHNKTYIPEGEIIVTAELANEYINGVFEWTAKFADPTAEWAVGKVADYYVSVEPIAGNSASVKMRYLAPFAEQIIITATLRGTDSSDSFTVDCLKPVIVNEFYSEVSFDFGVYFDCYYSLGLGTVAGDFAFNSALVEFTEDFKDDVQSYLNFDIALGSLFYSGPVEIDNSGTCVETDYLVDYITLSDIVSGFDNYDTSHQEAIEYAWNTAVNQGVKKYGFSYYNYYLTLCFDYQYNGVTANSVSCNEEAGHRISATPNVVSPSVTLNQNYVF